MNASNVARGVLAAVVLSTLTACATNGGYKAYSGSENSPKTIAILQPANLESYTLLNQGGAGKGMFGALGALAEMPTDMAKMKELDNTLKSAGFNFSTAFSEALKNKLEVSGYQVVVVPVERKKPMALVDNLKQVEVTADAILDVAVWSVGYANISIVDNDYRPDIKVDIALKSRSGSKLYSETIMYGYHNPFMSATDIDASKDYYFDNRDRLLEDSAKALEGLIKGVDAVATHVAGRLGPT